MLAKYKHFERPTSTKVDFPLAHRVAYLIVIAVIGMSTGALGFAMLALVLLPENLTSYSTQIELSRKQSGLNSLSLPLVPSLVEQTGKSMVLISVHEETQDIPNIFSRLPNPALYVATGFIATSDGWIVSPSAQNLDTGGSYDIYQNGVFMPVTAIIEDEFTGLFFLKTDLSDATPVEFFSGNIVGGTALVQRTLSFVSPQVGISFVDPNMYGNARVRNDLIYSSDTVVENKLVTLAAETQSPLFFDMDGRLVGVSPAIGTHIPMIPAHHIRIALESVLRNKEFMPLGLSYTIEARSNAQGLTGATLASATGKPAVLTRSLAASAGFKEGDVITAVNGELVSIDVDLGYLWRKHQGTASSVNFKVLREGRLIDVEVQI